MINVFAKMGEENKRNTEIKDEREIKRKDRKILEIWRWQKETERKN